MPIGMESGTPCDSSRSLFTLPEEVIIQVLLFLPLDDILRTSQACRDLFTIVTTSVLLRYNMELQISGLINVDDGRKELSTDQRLSLLRNRRYRWKNMDWRREDHWLLREGCPTYEIYGGVFAQLWEAREHDEDSDQGKLVTKLRVIYLSSATRGLAESMAVVHEELIRGSVAELSIDPDQDLVVLLVYVRSINEHSPPPFENGRPSFHLETHFRTLSTNLPHPAASHADIQSEHLTNLEDDGRLIPIIAGDLLAILYTSVDGASPSIIVVWRWTTGEELMMVRTDTSALSFAFLSDDTFVVPCTSQSPDWAAEVQVYRLPAIPEPVNPTPPTSIYRLPLLNKNSIVGINVVCRSHPLPNPRAYKPPARINHFPVATGESIHDAENEGDDERPWIVDQPINFGRPPFQTEPSDRLVTFSFIFSVHHQDELGHGLIAWQETWVLCTHVSALLAHIPSSPDLPPGPAFIVPWGDWASRTRWLNDRCRRNWYSHTYGHRFVKPTLGNQDDPFSMQVLDFNPWTVRTERAVEAQRELVPPLDGASSIKGAGYSILQSADRIEASNTPTAEGLSPIETFQIFNPAWFTSAKMVDGPSTTSGIVFSQPVTTSLPYIEITHRDPLQDFQGLMICEEQIVNVKASGPGLEMDIFSV
ncbi:hypothetical protein FRB98_001475 [Tulasnella sp. 332]|nr:hypothetical protein FRB98_001475 [Tulasnella sp. 332]